MIHDIAAAAAVHVPRPEEILSASTEIAVVQGPLRGMTVQRDEQGKTIPTFGAIKIREALSDDHPEAHADHVYHDYQRARDYISHADPTLRTIFLQLEDGLEPLRQQREVAVLGYPPPTDGQALEINTALRISRDRFHNYFTEHEPIDPGNPESESERCIYWSSRHALSTADGKGISAAMILAHEATHAYHAAENNDAFRLRELSPVARYTNLEEKLTITRENAACEKLSEGMRKTHAGGSVFGHDLFYPVRSEIDRTTKMIYPTFIADSWEKHIIAPQQNLATKRRITAQYVPKWSRYLERQNWRYVGLLLLQLTCSVGHLATLSFIRRAPASIYALIHDFTITRMPEATEETEQVSFPTSSRA